MSLGEGCVGCGTGGPALCPTCVVGLAGAAEVPVADVDRVLAAYRYEGPVRDLILGLKLRHRRYCAGPLVAGLVATVMRRGLIGSTITWVPCRRRDVLDRGFDHAHLIARGVGRALGLPTSKLLVRTVATVDQASLGRAERSANIMGAFAARNAPRTVVVVDDLLTTGATARACARALRSAGAERIELLVAARA